MFLRSNKKFKSEVFLEDTISSDKDDNTLSLIEVLTSTNDTTSIEDTIDFKIKIKNVLNQMKKVLKSREKLIIELRFGLNGKNPKTQKDIAQMLGISRSYVSRIETKAIKKLNKVMQE